MVASPDAVQQAHRDFANQQPARVGLLDLAERDTADDQHQRLTARDAAHAGDDGHQHRQRHDFLDGCFEQADDIGRQKGRGQIDAQPDRATARAGEDAGEHVLILAEAGHAHDRVIGFLADDVDDVVDGDAAEQPALASHNGGGHEVAVFEQLGYFARRGLGRNGFDTRVHHLADGFLRVLGEQPRYVHRAAIFVVAIDHEQLVGARW